MSILSDGNEHIGESRHLMSSLRFRWWLRWRKVSPSKEYLRGQDRNYSHQSKYHFFVLHSIWLKTESLNAVTHSRHFKRRKRCVRFIVGKINWKMDKMFVETKTIRNRRLLHCWFGTNKSKMCLCLKSARSSRNKYLFFPLLVDSIFSGSFLTLNKIPEIKWTNRKTKCNEKCIQFKETQLFISYRIDGYACGCLHSIPNTFQSSSTQNCNGRLGVRIALESCNYLSPQTHLRRGKNRLRLFTNEIDNWFLWNVWPS